MPALQKAKPTKLTAEGLTFASVSLPKQLRETKIVKDKSPDDIAREIVEWIRKLRGIRLHRRRIPALQYSNYSITPFSLSYGNNSPACQHRNRWLPRETSARSAWRGQNPDRRPARLEAGRRSRWPNCSARRRTAPRLAAPKSFWGSRAPTSRPRVTPPTPRPPRPSRRPPKPPSSLRRPPPAGTASCRA